MPTPDIPDSMPAAYLSAAQGMTYGQLLTPQPAADTVLVKVHAAAVNLEDIFYHRGRLPLMRKPPHVLGCDAAGEIVALGDSVDSKTWSIGDRVLVSHYDHLGVDRNGTYAGYVVVDPAQFVPLPDTLAYETAAACGYPFWRAWSGLIYNARLRKRETVVIKGASTPLGRAALAICKWKECTVVAIDKPQHTTALRAAGADMVFDEALSTGELLNLLMSITEDASATCVVDVFGGVSIQEAIQMLAIEGRVLSLATYASEDVAFNMADLVALNGALYTPTDTLREGDGASLLQMVVDGDLTPIIDSTVPLSQAAAAHGKIESNTAWGTIILTP